MSTVSGIIWRYAAFEREVQLLINSRCGGFCELCTARCCKPDRCEDAFDSAFLAKLHGYKLGTPAFDERHGWLNEKGCGIVLGRPAVCYEFFCEHVLNSQRSDMHRYVLKTLGRLVSHIGKNALGRKHLLEIQNEKELEKVPAERFCEQLNEGKSAVEHIRYFYENGELEYDGLEQLGKINTPPPDLTA